MPLSIKAAHFMHIVKSMFLSIPVRIKCAGKVKINCRQVWESKVFFQVKGKSKLSIGKNMHTRRNVSIILNDGVLVIGNNVFMNNNVSITALDRIEIGDGTTIANNVVIVDHDHDYKSGHGFLMSPVIIEKNVWIGANCTILRGTHIGEGSVIAAGSVVKGEVPPQSVYYQKRYSEIKSIM